MVKKRAKQDRLQANSLKPIVAASLVAILGLSSALSLLHFAFSSYHHCYCLLHGQFEEVHLQKVASRNASNASLDRVARANTTVGNIADSAPRHHEACALLNDGLPRLRLVPRDCPSTIIDLDNEKLARNASKPMVSRCLLFLLAPKHSPPEVVRVLV